MENKLIFSNAVRDLCGGVSDMTLWRWINDPVLAFPKPLYIGKRRYFREAEILAWIEVQAEASLGAARAYIAARPDPDCNVMRTYLAKLADAVDYATEHSIADEFVDPVRLTRKAMSDNLLPPPVIEVAQ